MKINFKLLLISLLGALFILFCAYKLVQYIESKREAVRDLKEIKDEGILRVVTHYSLVGYFVSGDSLAGFNYELLQLLQQAIGSKLEISLESNLNKSIEGLYSFKYDVIVGDINVTTELTEKLSFTEPISRNRQVLVQRKIEDSSYVRNVLSLGGKTIFVPKDSPAILRLKNLSEEIADTIYYKEDKYYSAAQLVLAVAAGDINYTICDEKVVSNLAETLPEIDYSLSVGFTHLEAWGVRRKSPIFLDSLNLWINKIKNSEEFDKIYEKYYLR